MGFFSRVNDKIKSTFSSKTVVLQEESVIHSEPVQSLHNEPVSEVVIPKEHVANETKLKVKQGMGNPLRKQPLVSEAMQNRIKDKEVRQKERAAKKRILKEQAEHASQEALAPIEVKPVLEHLEPHQWKPGQSGNPTGRPKTKYTRDAIIQVIAEVRAMDSKDPSVSTRWQKLMAKLYERALSDEIKTADLMLIMNFLADRLDGKAASDPEEDASQKPALTVNINATRFAVSAKGDVLDVE